MVIFVEAIMDFLVCNKVFARLSLPGCELWHLFGKYGKDISFLRIYVSCIQVCQDRLQKLTSYN